MVYTSKKPLNTVAPKVTADPWLLTCKLPEAVMLSVTSAPRVFKLTLPPLCKLAKRKADELDTEMSFHDPRLASSIFKTPVNTLPALLKFAT